MLEFVNAQQLATALKDASTAHHKFELATGKSDLNWADWYASYMARQIVAKENWEAQQVPRHGWVPVEHGEPAGYGEQMNP